MTRLRLAGIVFIFAGILLPIGLFSLPRLIFAYQEATNPRRFHYYYFAPESHPQVGPLVALATTIVFLGICLMVKGSRATSNQD